MKEAVRLLEIAVPARKPARLLKQESSQGRSRPFDCKALIHPAARLGCVAAKPKEINDCQDQFRCLFDVRGNILRERTGKRPSHCRADIIVVCLQTIKPDLFFRTIQAYMARQTTKELEVLL